jgi:hypothetical protein
MDWSLKRTSSTSLIASSSLIAVTPTPSILDDPDQLHVVPNMGFHLKRGVWFPSVGSPQT